MASHLEVLESHFGNVKRSKILPLPLERWTVCHVLCAGPVHASLSCHASCLFDGMRCLARVILGLETRIGHTVANSDPSRLSKDFCFLRAVYEKNSDHHLGERGRPDASNFQKMHLLCQGPSSHTQHRNTCESGGAGAMNRDSVVQT
uniref:Uncharacterized protein n=1 Tax=Noctiluca scintillans TaxID=2966 RepID=A0A7S1A5E5_NOCSC|mmetsp:Transcript_32097/g.85950  ORF Transcript_32097/g.85950 Transcript_32097/m.85950 type:complete len:147 (+) Transcript_32097:51-491(+)